MMPKDKKIIFYAPTWRDDAYHARGRYKFDLQFDVDRMQRELSDDYIILLRLHYLFLYDFSKYEDIRDLYVISDVLVTDYSSVFFDYAVLERPMIFYTYDIDNYRDKRFRCRCPRPEPSGNASAPLKTARRRSASVMRLFVI